jgi:CRP/FNR family transcriptional regulator/CRP/FNR family nitrogen fixation transcriptional regulator
MYLKLAASCASHVDAEPSIEMRQDEAERRLYHRLLAGRHLYLEGDEAHSLYEVKRGMLRLARVLENGRRQIVAFALPGDIVGFPEGDHHHTDCDAITDAVVLAHGRAALDDARVNPDLHRRLTRAALHEISALQDHFMMLSSKSATEKVASFLLTLAERVGEPHPQGTFIEIAMRRVDIADFLGLTNETVCRTITKFRKDGLIVAETAQRLIVADMAGLRARAEPD